MAGADLAALLLLCLAAPAALPGLVSANPDANRLYADLMLSYNRLVRPVQSESDTLVVKLGLKLSQLIDVNLRYQMMTTIVWMEQEWIDYKLKWDPDEYGGITKLHVPSEDIWRPDIVLYNNADSDYVVAIMNKATLHNDGRIVWKPPAIYKSSCHIDVAYFPFDSQTCIMKFGTWTWNGIHIDLRHINQPDVNSTPLNESSNRIDIGIDLSDFLLNVEWDVMAVPATRRERSYECCIGAFQDITFNVTLRRKTLFYTTNLILPCVVMSLLSILVFYLPSDSNEKMASSPADGSETMKRLYEDLFTDYNRLIVPIAPNKTKVTVTVGLKLGQILDLNLKQQILSTNVWLDQTWHDHRLEWDPDAYGGIDMVHVPAENIWIPDIVLFNNADGNYELTLIAKAVLYSNGMVRWNPPTMFRSTCEIDVEYFPFDIQTCFLRFGSWTYAGDEVDIRHQENRRKVEVGIDLSQFYKNVEWDIIDVPAYYNEVYYEGRSEPFQDITFKIVIRRKMLFYLVNLILPVALMTFMTVSVFYLPADSDEKVTLSISILTSLIVFFLLMLEVIPPTSLAVPLFGKYLLFTLVLVSLSACVSVYVLNIYHREPSVHQMSPRMRRLFLETLPRLLRLDQPDPRERSSLNRFRKKKLAQQILQARQNHKIYDLAQPVAASLNLIETLQKSYDYNPNDDTGSSRKAKNQTDEDEGRYFRRYVDNYIGKLQAEAAAVGGRDRHRARHGINNQYGNVSSSSSSARNAARCCNGENKCCPAANKPIRQVDVNIQRKRPDMLASSLGQRSGLARPQQQQQRETNFGINQVVHDDTFDMTFDYEDQFDQFQQVIGSESDLPSPPPPPRQLAKLSDSMKDLSGRLSGESVKKKSPGSHGPGQAISSRNEDEDDGLLVDKLISSINMINNVSDDVDSLTITSLSNVGDEYQQSRNMAQAMSSGPALPIPQARAYPTEIDPIRNEQSQAERQKCICDQQPNTATDNQLDGPRSYNPANHYGTNHQSSSIQHQQILNGSSRQHQEKPKIMHNIRLEPDVLAGTSVPQAEPSELLLSLRLSYDQMPDHVRAAIRSILFIADTIKNEDDENRAIEDWESMSMVVDRLFLWLFLLLCTLGSFIILAMAPSLYDQRDSIDDKLRIEIPASNCSAFKT